MTDTLPISDEEHIKLLEYINSLSIKESYKKEVVRLAVLLKTTGLRRKEIFMLNPTHIKEALSNKEFSLDIGRSIVVIVSLTEEDHTELVEVFKDHEGDLFTSKEEVLHKSLVRYMKGCLGKWFVPYSYRLAYKSR